MSEDELALPSSAWRQALWRGRWPLVFISPFFILFAVFNVYPIAFSFWLSLHDWPGLGPMDFVGLTNYVELSHDTIFWNSMLNAALLFFIYVPVMTFLAVVIAAVLNSRFLKLQGLWRALIFVPNITSMVAAGYTFRLILDKDSGALNHALAFVHVSAVPWLDDVWWARISLGLLMVWAWLGYNTVLMLGGLQTIPPELVEAAKVDGATAIQAFRRITVPLLRPMIVFSVTISIIGTFSMFTEPYILTRGGPIRATETPVYQIFTTTFQDLRFGYAAAESYVYFAIIVAVTLFQFWSISRRDPVH
ncbi:MAG TPA: sugar ABC transporter permease [Candidatus Dormibacteraeota bacterium]